MDNTTAKVSCFARAYHYKNNDVPVFADCMAEVLLGEEYEQIARNMTQGMKFFLPEFQGTDDEGLRLIVDHQLSPSVLARSAFCETALCRETRLGCTQYLIFASGYDTFALRNENTSLTVYELDLPEALEEKEKKIEHAGLTSGAVHVVCNLAEAGWEDKLLEKGFEPGKKSFGSMLGISYYLEKSEWENLLQCAANFMVKGSYICFDYPSYDESEETRKNKELAGGAGETMKALYGCEEMENILKRCGFCIQEHLDHKSVTEQYFAEYNRNMPEHPMAAPVGVRYILAMRNEKETIW